MKVGASFESSRSFIQADYQSFVLQQKEPKKPKSQPEAGPSLPKPAPKPVVEIISKSKPPPPQVTQTKKPRAPRKKRAIPEPTWEEVPTELNRTEAEDRILVSHFSFGKLC